MARENNRENGSTIKAIIQLLGLITFVWVVVKKWQEISGFVGSFQKDHPEVKRAVKKIARKVNNLSKEVAREVSLEDDLLEGSEAPEHVHVRLSVPGKRSPRARVSSAFTLNARQEKIYQLVKGKKEVAMPDILALEPGVSSRTLRRDMTRLEKLGLLEQVGRTKNSVYKLKQ